MREKALILDTCGLLWLVSGEKSISDSTRDAIERASISVCLGYFRLGDKSQIVSGRSFISMTTDRLPTGLLPIRERVKGVLNK